MVKIYKLGTKEQTTLEFDTVIQAEKFLTSVYDVVSNPVGYSDGIVYQCKTTAIMMGELTKDKVKYLIEYFEKTQLSWAFEELKAVEEVIE